MRAHGVCSLWQAEYLLRCRRAITPRTRAIIVNSPSNPCGKVFTRAELEQIAALAEEHDLFILTDEIYEYFLFDGTEHVSPGSLPGMAERTLRVGSSGKMFSLTGWKVGWVSGPAALTRAVANAHQFITFTTSPARTSVATCSSWIARRT